MHEIVSSQLAIVMGVIGILILGYTPMLDLIHDFYAVEIGLNPDSSHRDSHGFVWFDAGEKGRHRVPFTASRPDRLINPTRATVRSIWRQMHKAGLQPKSLEIRTGGRVRIYRRNADVPVMVY